MTTPMHVVISGDLARTVIDLRPRLREIGPHGLIGMLKDGRTVRIVSVSSVERIRGHKYFTWEVCPSAYEPQHDRYWPELNETLIYNDRRKP